MLSSCPSCSSCSSTSCNGISIFMFLNFLIQSGRFCGLISRLSSRTHALAAMALAQRVWLGGSLGRCLIWAVPRRFSRGFAFFFSFAPRPCSALGMQKTICHSLMKGCQLGITKLSTFLFQQRRPGLCAQHIQQELGMLDRHALRLPSTKWLWRRL